MVDASPPPGSYYDYRRAAWVSYLISDVLLVGAVVSWVWWDKVFGGVLGFFAVLLTIVAIRSAQVAFIRSQILDEIDRGETILAELGARRHVRLSWLRNPLFVVLTERYIYAFVVSWRPGAPIVRRAYNDVMAVRLGSGTKSMTLQIELPDQTLELVGLMLPQVERFEAVMAEKRPRLIAEPIAPVLAAAMED